jgi:nucleotide-binding universal stress UspA family protein
MTAINPSSSNGHSDGERDEALHGAVIVAAVPGQSARVLREGAHFARLMQAPLVIVHVDMTRFVTYEDPDGYVHSAPIDIDITPGAAELDSVRQAAHDALDAKGVAWELRQLVGDPAIALKNFAERLDAKLLVVGTRDRGIGESIREFFTGSVAARLAHRQHRPVLVVPLGTAAADDEDLWPQE